MRWLNCTVCGLRIPTKDRNGLQCVHYERVMKTSESYHLLEEGWIPFYWRGLIWNLFIYYNKLFRSHSVLNGPKGRVTIRMYNVEQARAAACKSNSVLFLRRNASFLNNFFRIPYSEIEGIYLSLSAQALSFPMQLPIKSARFSRVGATTFEVNIAYGKQLI